ncbi:CTTNBP 2 AMINO-TERMINAL-LIKE PROTEIN [Salix purpurea]|uniref:CTTNBP 2 AMINO-TERMINAL-LIKE PROTEIN n=1 Tax=Salix purpurea TaxID=77065 RepID=A0A9Q1ADL3_SALPP|nr:CTTNBP 2 AMINO-TERMINAL-LIKE PROTEIN [Salix purpurea]
MVAPDGGSNVWPPTEAPLLNVQREDQHWRHFDNSVNAVSFGFVATAILISMFLVMAIFERFLRPPSGRDGQGDLESQMGFNSKLGHPSPKVSDTLLSPLCLHLMLLFKNYLFEWIVCFL